MTETLKTEEDCLKKITKFNKTTKGIKQDIDVVIRAVCSVLEINTTTQAGLELIRTFPEGTIFTRTCREGGGGGGLCGQDLAKHTTFTNMTTLGNLMIGNPTSINDSVVFLKTKTDVKFLDLTVVAQLFGAPVKSGVPAQDEVGSGGFSRGIFSACCPINHMVDFCRRLGVHGVIQIDSADAYYFNEDAHWIPEELKQGDLSEIPAARHLANELVLEAIINKRAYPVFQEYNSGEAFVGIGNDPRLANSGALFPEFNFHTDELKECLDYCPFSDPVFQAGRALYTLAKAAHEVENLNRLAAEYNDKAIDPEYLSAAADLRNTADTHAAKAMEAAADIPFKMVKVRRIAAKLTGGGKRKRDITTDYYEVPCWNLDKILSNEDTARSYLNFQKDDYPFQQISDYQWVENVIDTKHVLRLNPTLVARQRLINTMFSPPPPAAQSSFVGLPYLHGNINELINQFEIPIIQLLFSDDQIADCVKQEGTVTIWDGTEERDGTEEHMGGRKKTSKKRTPYRKQKTKRNSKLKPRRRRKGRTRRTRYKKKAGNPRR